MSGFLCVAMMIMQILREGPDYKDCKPQFGVKDWGQYQDAEIIFFFFLF